MILFKEYFSDKTIPSSSSISNLIVLLISIGVVSNLLPSTLSILRHNTSGHDKKSFGLDFILIFNSY